MVVTTDREGGFVPPTPPPRWWLRAGIALVVVAALVAGGLWARQHFLIRCGDGVRTQGPRDECIGVTDGAYVFDDHIKKVVDKIRAENLQVDKSGKAWVAVAYVEPMTRGAGDKGWDSIREELEGAYLAQHELNTESGGHGTTPQIKLLLANPGSGLRQWSPLVDRLVSMTHGEHPVVAVAGFGQSRAQTREAVERLRKEGVPMVGATVTADRLSTSDPPGFFRAVSPNSAQSAAVVNHLARAQHAHDGFRVQLVKDRNSDDIYSRSLSSGFTDAARRAGLEVDPVAVPFLSGEDGVDNALASVADKVCDQQEPPDAVYFAGRGRDLRRFIEAAGADGRHCPVTVYTGDDAVGMFFGIAPRTQQRDYDRFLRRWSSSGVRVQYTALAHPDAAADIYPHGHNPYPAFAAAYADDFGGQRGLLNGQAMLGHDALLAVGEAIRAAAGSQGADTVHTGDVLQMLLQITGHDALDGVSGPIDFDEQGDPRHKPLPLVELHPRSRNAYEYLSLVRP
jgi:ABC-type branched-subunit amino acid transport system substrate-binding protein